MNIISKKLRGPFLRPLYRSGSAVLTIGGMKNKVTLLADIAPGAPPSTMVPVLLHGVQTLLPISIGYIGSKQMTKGLLWESAQCLFDRSILMDINMIYSVRRLIVQMDRGSIYGEWRNRDHKESK